MKTAHALATNQGQIPYILQRSKRRSLAIVVDLKGSVKVFAPAAFPEHKIHKFVELKQGWILKKIIQFSECSKNYLCQAARLDRLPYLGKEYQVLSAPHERRDPAVRFSPEGWKVSCPDGVSQTKRDLIMRKRLVAWFRHEAKRIVGERIDHYQSVIGVTANKVSVRTQRTMWGNCYHHTRKIHINWKVIFAPLEVVDYVIVHELCHLIFPNHSRRFWKKVAEIFPRYEFCRKYLKDNVVNLSRLEVP